MCGVLNERRDRIIGGGLASLHKYPWQAYIFNETNGQFICGAVIISDQWLLSAAHCVEK